MNALNSQFNEKDNVNLQRVLNYDLLIKLIDRSPCSSSDYLQLKPDLYSWNKETEKRKASWVMFYIKLFAVTNDCTQFPPFNIRKFPNQYSIGLQFVGYATAELDMGGGNTILATSLDIGSIGETYSVESRIVNSGNYRSYIQARRDSKNNIIYAGDKSIMLTNGNCFTGDINGVNLFSTNNKQEIDNGIYTWTSDSEDEIPVSGAWWKMQISNNGESIRYIKYVDGIEVGRHSTDLADSGIYYPDLVDPFRWLLMTKTGIASGAADVTVTLQVLSIAWAIYRAQQENTGLKVSFGDGSIVDYQLPFIATGPIQLSL